MPSIANLIKISVFTACVTAMTIQAANAQQSASELAPDIFQNQPVKFPNGVSAWPDVVYHTEIGYRPLRLDLYRSADDGKPKPVILYVHGGAWEGGTKRRAGAIADFPAVLASLAAKGYVVASAEHRLSGEAPFPAALHDIQNAIRFLRENAGPYGIDTTRFAIWGSSSGGQLAALAAVACNNKELENITDRQIETSSCVDVAAIWNGVFDFKAMEPAPKPSLSGHPRSRFLNCNPGYCTSFVLDTASPIHYVDAKNPPFFLAHGFADKVVPIAQSQEFEKALRNNGVETTTYYVEKVGHGFITSDEDSTRKASDALVEKTFAYFDAHLKPN